MWGYRTEALNCTAGSKYFIHILFHIIFNNGGNSKQIERLLIICQCYIISTYISMWVVLHVFVMTLNGLNVLFKGELPWFSFFLT